MSLPRMSWHIGDYKRDTGNLRAAGHGAYFLLTMHYWATGGLPDDDKQLASIACMTDREWKALRPTIAAFFKPRWRHKRIDEELAAAQEKYEKLSAAGKKGGRPPKEKPSESQAFETVKPAESQEISDHEASSKQPITDNPKEEKKEATGSEGEPVRAKLKYPAAFEGWWLAYPKTPVMSKKEALTAWGRLSEDDRLAAVAALPKYAAFLKSKPDHPVVHACRFLSQRRFDGFGEAPTQAESGTPAGFYAADGSPELDAWDEFYRGTKHLNAPRDKNCGWRFPARWPPTHEERAA